MKKVILLAMSALLVTGATFAEGTQKKACCKKAKKGCCKKPHAKAVAKEQTTKM